MKNTSNLIKFATACVALAILTISCTKTVEETTEAATQEVAKSDMMDIKAEIQELENGFAKADNERNAAAIAAFYADDAQSLSNNKPTIIGKEALLKDIEANMAKRVKGSTIAFDILDVYGDENQVTEVGKSTGKDSTGKVTYTGKYMAIWEKRDGKYVCIRDIGNDDVKEK